MPRTRKQQRTGFTLVEILTVIVIIGILAALTVGAVYKARLLIRQRAIQAEIMNMSQALEQYRQDCGELPPDFSDPAAVTRHLRKRFPKYQGGYAQMKTDILNEYGVDINGFSPASALVFWLGGLPMDAGGDYRGQGFHTDPTNPFQDGGPRTTPAYDFDMDRVSWAVIVNPMGAPVDNDGDGNDDWALVYNANAPVPAPYVYFRSTVIDQNTGRRGYDPTAQNYTYNGTTAVPYMKDATMWYGEDSQDGYQIISAGLDGDFGTEPVGNIRVVETATNFELGDHDNIANFAKSTLEGEVQ